MQAIVQILLPMAGPRVREALSYAFSQVFREYTNAIASQFTHYRYADSTLPKVLGKHCHPEITKPVLEMSVLKSKLSKRPRALLEYLFNNL